MSLSGSTWFEERLLEDLPRNRTFLAESLGSEKDIREVEAGNSCLRSPVGFL